MLQSMVLRPAVGMSQIMAVPYVVALGVCDAVEHAGIAWPYDVVDTRTGALLSRVEARGGYDDGGMFVKVTLDSGLNAQDAVFARVDAWAEAPAVAPLAAVLADYANKLVQLGEEVQVTYPNGSELARGTFVGVDIWGRATVRLSSGESIEFPPEKYCIA